MTNNLTSLVWVILVAFVAATIFTFSTPSGLFSGQFARLISEQARATTEAPLAANGTEQPGAPAKPLIGVVAGHWGNDSGAVCADGYREVDINLKVATIVQKQLVDLGFEVDLLKEFDERLTGYQAAALISIHADSCDFINEQATGFKVASSMANPNPSRSARLTACLRTRYELATTPNLPFHPTSVTPDMTSYHAFGEIHPDTTAAIIEIGFLNLDRQYLENNSDAVAKGITDGIMCFLNNENINP